MDERASDARRLCPYSEQAWQGSIRLGVGGGSLWDGDHGSEGGTAEIDTSETRLNGALQCSGPHAMTGGGKFKHTVRRGPRRLLLLGADSGGAALGGDAGWETLSGMGGCLLSIGAGRRVALALSRRYSACGTLNHHERPRPESSQVLSRRVGKTLRANRSSARDQVGIKRPNAARGSGPVPACAARPQGCGKTQM